jgi:hypothetical protein
MEEGAPRTRPVVSPAGVGGVGAHPASAGAATSMSSSMPSHRAQLHLLRDSAENDAAPSPSSLRTRGAHTTSAGKQFHMRHRHARRGCRLSPAQHSYSHLVDAMSDTCTPTGEEERHSERGTVVAGRPCSITTRHDQGWAQGGRGIPGSSNVFLLAKTGSLRTTRPTQSADAVEAVSESLYTCSPTAARDDPATTVMEEPPCYEHGRRATETGCANQ